MLGACARDPRGSSRVAGSLPIHEGNLPVDPAAAIERSATLRIYQWRDYLAGDVLDSFARRHAGADVELEVESFTTMAEAVERLRRPDGDFDVFFPTIGALPRLAAEGLLRPLTHELLPNRSNLWPFFLGHESPFYDPGPALQRAVHGVLDRDRLAPGPRRERGRAGEAGQSLRRVLERAVPRCRRHLRRLPGGHRDGPPPSWRGPEHRRRAAVGRAVDDLVALAEGVDVEVSSEGAYEELQTGEYAFQQSWSGDLLSAKRFGAAAADDAGEVAFTWPHGGIVGCDLTAICARGRNPVLAHAFLDHLLDVGVALRNFRWNGYQPPVGEDLPEVPAHLGEAILRPDDLTEGRFLRPLGPEADTRWQVGWQRFLSALPSP